jgi:O-antigen ligase
VYASTLVAPALLLAALAFVYRPAILRRGGRTAIDILLTAVLAAILLQLLPLPRGLVRLLSPGALRISDQLSLVPGSAPLSLALDLQDAVQAALLVIGSVVLFFVARRIFESGGSRTVTRGLAASGVVLACIAIAQDATGHGLMYWRWRPIYERAFPFGPFVNRNHFGAWAMMVVPLCIGYLVAHTATRSPQGAAPWRRRLLALLDTRTWLLLSAIVLLTVATVVSLSRSSMIGLACAILAGGVLAVGRGRQTAPEPRALAGIAVAGAAALGAILLRVDAASVADRVAAVSVDFAGRADIWRTTVEVIKDFWLTGTGVGTYQTAMAVYQRPAGVIFNQAHNQYLQVAAEGGLLVCVPAAAALALFWQRARTALRADQSAMYWLRVGAASGLAGLAVQCLLEAPLLTPANAALAAVLAAIVIHVPARSGAPQNR